MPKAGPSSPSIPSGTAVRRPAARRRSCGRTAAGAGCRGIDDEHRLGRLRHELIAEGARELAQHFARREREAPGEAVLVDVAAEQVRALVGVRVERHHHDVAAKAWERVTHNHLLRTAAASPDGHADDEHLLAGEVGERELLPVTHVREGM